MHHLVALKLLCLSVLLLVASQVAAEPAEIDEQLTPLHEEPLLRDLFAADRSSSLKKLSSCLDSVFRLQRAYEVMHSLKSIYNDHLSNRTDHLTDVEQRLLVFCRDSLPIGGSPNYFHHPVNVHKFVTFTARVMNPRLLELVQDNPGVRLLLAQLIANAECWLNEASVAESAQNLLTIKSFYNISMGDFALGNFGGDKKPEAGFTAKELMELLLHLNRQFEPRQVVELGEYLRRERLEELKSLGEQPVRSMYRILGKAYYQMKQFDKALDALREYQSNAGHLAEDSAASRGIAADVRYIEANRLGEPADFEKEQARRRGFSGLEREFGLTQEALAASGGGGGSPTSVSEEEARARFRRYRRLCGVGGTDAGNRSSNALLICELWRPYNGWYPIRKEILSDAPLVVRYFDVFLDTNATDAFMQETEKRIHEAPPEDKDSDLEKQNRLTKVCMHAFSGPLAPFESNATKSIIRRLEFVTRMDASEHFVSREKYINVANHGHGIRNKPHVAAELPKAFQGLATALFFPVDEVVGGELLILEQEIKIPIRKSDLVVWYHYLPTYHLDRTAQYAACPILFGDKWTARVTLGMKLCSMDQEVRMEYWLPGKTLARRRSSARNWTVVARPKPALSLNAFVLANATHVSGNATTAEDEQQLAQKQEPIKNATAKDAGSAGSVDEAKASIDSADAVESNNADEKEDEGGDEEAD